jgi:peroxiredoxin
MPWGTESVKSTAVPVGSVAPDFTLPGTDGQPHRLADHRGQPVVVLFYRGHWCGACRAQMADLRRAHLLFADAGAVVLPVSSEPLDRARDGAARDGVPFPVLSDPELRAIDRYGVRHDDEPEGRPIARPSVFVLDREGVVRFAHVGAAPRDRPPLDLVLLALESMA